MFKLPNKKEVYKQFLNHHLVGKKVNLYFAEYGKEGSDCKYIVESTLKGLTTYQHWKPINIQKIEVIIKDCKKSNIENWFEIFFDPIKYANLSVNSAIITEGILEIQ